MIDRDKVVTIKTLNEMTEASFEADMQREKAARRYPLPSIGFETV